MNRKGFGAWIVLIVVGVLLAYSVRNAAPSPQAAQAPKNVTTTFDQVQSQLLNQPQSVKEIVFVKSGPLDAVSSVQVTLTNGTVETAPVPGEAGSALLLNAASKTPAIKIDAAKAPESSGSSASTIFSILINLAFPILLIGFFIWQMRAARNPRGQMGKFAQSGANKVQPTADRKTFADVAGCENAKRELMEIVEFLRNPGQLHELGGKRQKGVLLVGDPGNGKTLLAKAVAGEANVPFFQVSGSSFVEMFVGVGASRVRDLFNTARPNQPCIIFIDEIDAVGRQRGTGLGGGNDEREQTLNQLLVEMDGFVENDSIVLMAATNRPDILDPALVRPGRFDMQVLVEAADMSGRMAILKVHTRKMKLGPDVDLRHVASATPGFSGAQLAGAANQAALVANRRITAERKKLVTEGKSAAEAAKLVPIEVNLNDFDEGVTRVQMGPASDKAMTKEDLENTAYHELGHAYVSQVRHNEGKGGDPVTKITIVARARALGYTQALPRGDRYNYTQSELYSRIMMAMGGRVAQEVFLNTIDTGASNDFEQATNIAYRMVTDFGMSDLGPIHIGENNTNPFLGRSMANGRQPSAELLARVDREVEKILKQAYADTRALIERDRSCFKHIAEILLAQETILGPQWETLFNEMTCQEKKITHEDLPPVRPDGCESCADGENGQSGDKPGDGDDSNTPAITGLIDKLKHPQRFMTGNRKADRKDGKDDDGSGGPPLAPA
ncbi:MAG TPA: ATP-dependent zinc metalloprotease FtsH [Planktothrix sp.]|jgi:cell division protease FtsH